MPLRICSINCKVRNTITSRSTKAIFFVRDTLLTKPVDPLYYKHLGIIMCHGICRTYE